MKIAFNPSTVAALITPPNNKDITFDLRGRNIFARGVKFCGTDTWRDIKINNVSIDSNILDLRNGSNTTLTNTNGVVTINSTWRPVVDNLTSDSTTSSLSANQGRVLKALIDGKSDSEHTHDDRYLKLTGGWMSGDINFGGDNRICWGRNTDSASISFKNDGDGDADSYMSFVTSDNDNEYFRWSHSSGSTNTEWMALRSDGLRVGGTKVSLEGHSHNDLYYTKTEVNNKLNGKSDTSHTHDDRYLKLTGGTMSGTIYRNSGGSTISGRDHAIIRQTHAPGDSSWNPIACVDTETGTWTLGHLSSGSNNTDFNFCFSTNADYNAGNNNGNYVTLRNKVGTIALLSDIPSSLKNPYALTISLNGTSQGPYDGSTAKNINITPSSIGAATSDHNHDGRYVRKWTGVYAGPNVKFLKITTTDEKGWIRLEVSNSTDTLSGGYGIYIIGWGYHGNNGTDTLTVRCLYANDSRYTTALKVVRTSRNNYDFYFQFLNRASFYGYTINYSDQVSINYAVTTVETIPIATWTSSLAALQLNASQVDWSGITNKPSEFNPAAHTHTVFKNNLMIKGTNGISDSASIHLGIGDSDTGFKWISNGKCQIYANNVAVGEWTQNGMNWFINPTVNGNKIWNAGNDGSGSGLDADTLDGYHENSFLRYRGTTSTDQEATLWDQIGIKTYLDTLPDGLTGVYSYGSVISLPGNGSRFEIYASHWSSSGNGLYYRSGWNSDKKSWLKFIDSSNIGSQTVASANKLTTARKIWGQSFDGTADISGNMSSVGQITFSALSGTNGRALLYQQMADNDFFRIYVGGTESNSGYVEIATADDGNEPIYVRQYTGVFSSVKRTLTLLDANGYTHFPSYINIGGNENNNSSPDRVWGSNSSDSYLRSYRTSALRVSYASSAGNADTIDNIHSTGFLRWKGMQNIGNNAPFQAVVDIIKDTSKLNDGGLSFYSYAGDEYTVLIGSRNDVTRHGNALKWGYANKYLWMIRMINGSPKSSDWEKISAGYADSAGSVAWDNITGKPSVFTPSAHSHSWDSITGKPTSFTPSAHNHDDRYIKKIGDMPTNAYDLIITPTNLDREHVIDPGGGIHVKAYTGTPFQLWLHDTSNVWYKKTDSGAWTKMDAGYADNADMLDGVHANGLFTALSNSDNGISITVGGTTKSVSNISVNYASYASSARKLTSLGDYTYNNLSTDIPTNAVSYKTIKSGGTDLGDSQYNVLHIPWADGDWGTYLLFGTNNGRFGVKHKHSGIVREILDSFNYKSYAIPTSASCNKNWSYSGQSGQPTWLWGTNDGSNCYVWNPSNFRVAYASSAGNADTVDGYYISGESRQVYRNHYTVDNPASAWILIKFPAWNGYNEIVTISGYGDNRYAHCVVYCGSRNQGIWGYQSNYNGIVVTKIRWKEVDSGKFALVVLINGGITNLSIKSTSSLEISKTTEDNAAFAISSSFFSSGGVFHGNVDWDNITGKPSSFTPSAHTHSWTSITDKLVAGNEFNIVNAGFNNRMWFNYAPINDGSKTATILDYGFGNGHQGYATVTASGFIKNGSSSSYVLLGDGGHKTISSLSVNYANSAGNADTATKLTSSAGNAALPIYFSDGKPVACTASSVFSNLSNSGNNLSITVAGQNRTLTVGYATSAGSTTKVIVNQHTTNDTNYPLVWSNQNNSNNATENQLYKSWSDLYYNPKNKRLTVGGSVVASSFIKSDGTSQQLLRADGGIATFNWSGQSEQPTWLWGGNNEHSYYIYNPSNFRVAYATSAGSADTLDGVHLSEIFTAFGNNGHNITATIGGTTKSFLVNWAADSDKLDGYHVSDLLTSVTNTNNGISVTVGGTTKSVSNISVNYATSSGNADTLDGEHAKDFVRAGFYENNNLNSLDTYSFIRSVNSQVSSTSPKGDIGWYNVIQLVHRNGDDDGSNYIGQIALGMTTNVNDIFFRCRRTDPWKTIIHSNNYTEFINNYYWANVKISTSSSTTTSPTVYTLTATRVCAGHNPEIDNSISCSNWFRSSGATGWYNTTYQGGWYMSDTSWIRAHNGVGIYTDGQIYSSSSIRMGNIYLQNTNEINSTSDIHLNYQNSGNISLCVGGGNVGIGTTSPAYKLDVNGGIHSSGTINCNALNVGSTLSIKDSAISCSASDISIESKESGSLLINSREVLSYDSNFIYMNNRIDLLHGLCFRTSILDTTYNIYTTDDVTVLIGVLRDNSSFKFRPAKDGQLLFLKIGKLYSDTYFWCTAENCVVVRAKDFGIYLDKNQNKDCFGDGQARIFIYVDASNRWYEFYCG